MTTILMHNQHTATEKCESVPNFLCDLSHMSVIGLTGEQNIDYLQGQVSVDISTLTGENVLLGCHCDAKGKTLSVFNTVAWQDSIIMLLHSGSFQPSFDALKKFGVFAKTEILDKTDELKLIGGKGPKAESIIHTLFGALPSPQQVLSSSSGFVIHFDQPETRYLIALPDATYRKIKSDNAEISADNTLWQLMDIKAGIPNIDNKTSAEFIPQMMNLQAINAISFTKGCYMGQETIARNKYLGKNKRASFILVASENIDVENGDLLERQVGENWRRGGTVLSSTQYEDQTWLFAVLPNDTNPGSILRLKDEPNTLFVVKPLPYSLEE